MHNTNESDGGYSLLEALIALTVAMITLMGALQILSFASNVSSQAIVRGELTASARTAATVMNTKIQRAEAINIVVDGNNTLSRLELRPGTRAGQPDVFVYDPHLPSSAPGYNRLVWNDNEVASNLADIRIFQDGSNTIVIEILTDSTITVNIANRDVMQRNPNITVKPVIIRFPVNISGKTIG